MAERRVASRRRALSRAGAGGDAGREHVVRLSVEEHRRLLDTLRACAAAADAASLLANAAPQKTSSPKTTERSDVPETSEQAPSTLSLEQHRRHLLRSLARALGALQEVTDEQGRRTIDPATTATRVRESRNNDDTPRKRRQEIRRAATAEKRHKSTPGIGSLRTSGSLTSLKAKKHHCSRLREREGRISKRACGVIKVVVKKRQAESEPQRHKVEEKLDSRESTTPKKTSKLRNSRLATPRNQKNVIKPSTSKYTSRNESAHRKVVNSIPTPAKRRERPVKGCFNSILAKRSDNSVPNETPKKRRPFSFGLCLTKKQSKEKHSSHSKVGVFGICTSVADQYKRKKSSENERGKPEMVVCSSQGMHYRTNSYPRRRLADRPNSRFSTSVQEPTLHTHQVTVSVKKNMRRVLEQ